MYLTMKQQVKQLSKEDYRMIKYLSHIAKNLTNEAIYNIRQYYFKEGKYLNYEKNCALLKTSLNYKRLNSNMAQQILKEVDGMFQAFFELVKSAKKGNSHLKEIRLPHYLPKDGFAVLIIGFVRLNRNQFTIPYSSQFRKEQKGITVDIPSVLADKKVKEIRVIPKVKARFFEIQYTYEVKEVQSKLNKENALAIDFGVNNLATCVTNTGRAFIVDGKRLKSINQWFYKENTRLQSIKEKQKFGEKCTKRQELIARNHNNRVNDYIAKTARMILNFCLKNDIGTIVCGYSETFQRNSHIEKSKNPNLVLVSILFEKIREKIESLCKIYGIIYIEQEESYTSKASFFDRDEIPIYNVDNPQEYKFSGRREKRGLYKNTDGTTLNADVNGALNILKKSNVVSLERLYSRGGLDTPIRIRVA